jgi:hypothetical protein
MLQQMGLAGTPPPDRLSIKRPLNASRSATTRGVVKYERTTDKDLWVAKVSTGTPCQTSAGLQYQDAATHAVCNRSGASHQNSTPVRAVQQLRCRDDFLPAGPRGQGRPCR